MSSPHLLSSSSSVYVTDTTELGPRQPTPGCPPSCRAHVHLHPTARQPEFSSQTSYPCSVSSKWDQTQTPHCGRQDHLSGLPTVTTRLQPPRPPFSSSEPSAHFHCGLSTSCPLCLEWASPTSSHGWLFKMCHFSAHMSSSQRCRCR